MFEVYGNNPPVSIVADDLLAVTLLSIRVSGLRAKHPGLAPDHLLAVERHGSGITDLLSELPHDVDLHELSEERAYELLVWEPGTPAYELFQLIRYGLGLAHDPGSVATYKLLARKRPRLLPVRDRAVKNHLGHGADRWWHSLQDTDVTSRLQGLHSRGSRPARGRRCCDRGHRAVDARVR